MPKIKLLTPEVIKKIAAGEVVEKPASIVKELIENAVDAGASEISIEIKNGGIDYIKIVDNGSGMTAEDLKLSTQLHATSKLERIEDLQEIISLGFRGEALASIAAVSDLEIISAPKTGTASLLTTTSEIQPAARGKGTTVTIKNLFRQVPARRKFLKSARAEEAAIRLLVKQFAVNFPERSWKYSSEGKQVLDLRPAELAHRLSELFSYTEKDLISINTEADAISATGLIVHPKLAQKRGVQYIFINNRIVKSSLITAAVKQAYAEKIPRELQPSFFLKLNLEGSEVDVNIHPRKEEVKFSDDSKLFRFILRTVQEALATAMRSEFSERFTNIVKTPMSAPANKSRPYKISSSLEFSKNLLQDKGPDYNPKPALMQLPDISLWSGQTSALEYLQIFDTYIIIQRADNLLVIDQHAADERVNFEKIKQQLKDEKLETVPLLIAPIVELNSEISSGLEPAVIISALEKLGFKLTEFGEIAGKLQFQVEAVPLLLANKLDIEQIFRNILLDLQQEQIDLKHIEAKLDLVCATLACHSSIRAGQKLTEVQVKKLVQDLWDCQDPYTCPHGRPIVWEVKRSELEKNFLRRK